jgi:hypothetical protein
MAELKTKGNDHMNGSLHALVRIYALTKPYLLS